MKNKIKMMNMVCAIGGYNANMEQLTNNKYISKKKLKKMLLGQMECLERMEKILKV